MHTFLQFKLKTSESASSPKKRVQEPVQTDSNREKKLDTRKDKILS